MKEFHDKLLLLCTFMSGAILLACCSSAVCNTEKKIMAYWQECSTLISMVSQHNQIEDITLGVTLIYHN